MDYIKKTIRQVLKSNKISRPKLVNDLCDSLKEEIMKFHKYQNEQLTKALLIKQTRINKLESRIDNQD